ncbi:MAG TPA: DUF262 domain-containing protein [bacterium]|nr:DUF262 domain-containing protein [bacterium]
MRQPKPLPAKYNDLMHDIEKGYIKIPKFQRDFVWTIEETAKLLDSIIKGYPIGTFIFWKTRERLRSIKNIGGAELPTTPEGDSAQYVLDGQQRLASLYAARSGLQVEKGSKVVDYKKIYIDLDIDTDTDDQIVSIELSQNSTFITLYELLSSDMGYLVENYPDHINKINEYQQRFNAYDFSTIVIADYPIDTAVEIFTRINTTGTELTLFEIMAAKTFDEGKNFDLQDKYVQLQDELVNIQYDVVPSSTILQCLSVNIVEECTRKAILRLDKNAVINIWDDTVNSIKSAIDYFSMFYRVPVARLLPYNALLVPFSYFFFKNKDRPNSNQETLLQQYFWRSSLSYRFSSAVETKLGQDIKRINQMIKGESPEYDFKVLLNKDVVKNLSFSTGDSYCKAILCLYTYFKPKSFRNNSDIILDNSWLKQSNSRNYHHFFPRAYLKKKGIPNDNVTANITLVDDYLNKREIGSKPPSEYMAKFKRTNPELNETMKTHLIDNMEEFGVWENDYDKFLDKRTEKIVDELRKRVNI